MRVKSTKIATCHRRKQRVHKLNPLSHVIETKEDAQVIRNSNHCLSGATFERFQTNMGVAVGAHDIKRVQSLMDELLVLVERGDTEPLLKTPKSVVVDYLELCERELRLLVEQEELERTRQRLHGNEQMKQVVDKLHVPVIDIESINLLLSDVDKSYRRARDKRCVDTILLTRYLLT